MQSKQTAVREIEWPWRLLDEELLRGPTHSPCHWRFAVNRAHSSSAPR